MKFISEKLFIPFLNLMANISVILPFAIYFEIYNQNGRNLKFLLPLLLIYGLKSSGIFLGTLLRKSNEQILLLSIALNIIGYFFSAFYILNPIFLILGSIFLGISASWGWPYFLTAKNSLYFKITKRDWEIGGILLSILSFTFALSLFSDTFILLFLLLSFTYLVTYFPLLNLLKSEKRNTFSKPSSSSEFITDIILFSILLLIFIIERYARTAYTKPNLFFGILVLSIIIVGIIIIRQRNNFKTYYFIPAFTRGFVMSFVLFYSSFYSLFYFHIQQILIIYFTYLLGFESSSLLFSKVGNYRYLICVLGLLMTIFPIFFQFGIFLCSLFIGMQNKQVNTLYGFKFQKDTNVFTKKYQFSSLGSFSFQILYMLILTITSIFTKDNLISYFISTNFNNSSRTAILQIHFILILVIVVLLYKSSIDEECEVF